MAVDKLNKSEMGKRIRKARENLGWTREQFSEKVSMSVNAISNLELGKSGARLDRLYHICAVLGVNLDYILRGESTKRDAVTRITDLLSFQNEKTLTALEKVVRAALEMLE